jgi:maltose alpha-D-glucosyltransferase/alpha-amylase
MSSRSSEWLQDAVLYNIYPQSFYDANGDGIGDLTGIEQKLGYIQSLGVDAIWLNPVYESPFQDAGYDVTNHYKVAARYGTQADLKRLLAACHRRGLRLILDLVPGHTSLQHPWFQKSTQGRKNKYADWYIWTQGEFDGEPDLVRGYAPRGHFKPNFFWFQPALNYGYAKPTKPWQLPVTHPAVQAVREELKRLMRYWLDFGVDGFRVDMAASLVKEDSDNRENRRLWRGLRQWMDEQYPDRVLISEWSLPPNAIDSGFHMDFLIHFNNEAYNSLFRMEPGANVSESGGHSYFRREGRGDLRVFWDHYLPFLNKTRRKGLISVPTGNHDLPRINFGRSVEELKVAYAFLFTLPGTPTLYYGDEIGMRNATGLPSKEGGYIRTAARTPMQWTRGRNAGFSTAPKAKLYLPVDTDRQRPNVATQEKDPASLLHFVRRLIALRKAYSCLRPSGEFLPLYAEKDAYPFAYLRQIRTQRILVILNPSGQEREVAFDLPTAVGVKEILASTDLEVEIRGRRAHCRCGGCSYWAGRLGKA